MQTYSIRVTMVTGTTHHTRRAPADETPDLELYARLAQDEASAQAALSVLYRRYSQRIYTYCRKILGDNQTAEDLLQETFVKLFESGKHGRSIENFPAYLMTIARNLSYGTNTALKWTVGAWFLLALGFAIALMVGYVDRPDKTMDPLDALYFSVETIATIGYGDFSFDGQPAYLRVLVILVMIATVVLLATFYALVTEYLVSRRIAATFGLARATGMSGHILVVGLGTLGIAVVEQLVAMKQLVVVVERDPNNRHIGRARALNVPVLAQDATQEETLIAANLPGAAGVAVLTSDEYANIETGLAIRDALGSRSAHVPVVMRVFDRRLSAILEQRLHFHHVRSVSAVSAPWFVAAALGLDVIATFTVDQEAFIAGRLTVRADGGLPGVSMLDLPMRARVIALFREGGLEHLPRSKTTLQAGDDAYVVGPPEDLLLLLIHNRAGAAVR